MQPFIYPTLHREYRTATGWRLVIYLLAPPLIVVFLATPFLLFSKSKSVGVSVAFLLLMWGLAAFLLFGLLEARKAKFTITAHNLVYESLLGRKVIPLANLKGYRTDWQYTYFVSTNPADPKIKISYTTEDYANMQQWFADRFPELNQLEQAEEAAQVLIDPALGPTEEDRLTTVAQARQVARLLNTAGVVVAVWLLHPQPYRWAVAASVAVPLLVIAALWQHPGTLRLDERGNSSYPSVLTALLLPAFALFGRAAFDFELESYAPFWPRVGAVAAGLAVLLMGSRWRQGHLRHYQSAFVLAVVLYVFFFSVGATVLVNCVFDESSAAVYPARVVGKETSSSQTTTYYLKLSPWGPRTTSEIVTVGAAYYRQMRVGDSLHIYLRPGRLHVPWLEVKD